MKHATKTPRQDSLTIRILKQEKLNVQACKFFTQEEKKLTIEAINKLITQEQERWTQQ